MTAARQVAATLALSGDSDPGHLHHVACIDCGDVPEQESTWEYGRQGQVEWTRRPGVRCWPCHQDREDRREREAEEQPEAARAANAVLRPCWTCRGSIGGKEDSKLELREKARPDRLECPDCVQARAAKDLGPLVLPVPTKRELVAALVSIGRSVVGGPRAAREALPGEEPSGVTCWSVGAWNGRSYCIVWTFGWTCMGVLSGRRPGWFGDCM
ncbi:hypothetical protein C2142_04450 [Streptomyces sp. CB01881]|nr:hypothetical protein C2142_04450 [Streptomyces sp. CB01881]